MSEETKQQKESQTEEEANTNTTGGYQTPIEEGIRQTGVAAKSGAKPTATPEAPENDSVPGSPNQGTESR